MSALYINSGLFTGTNLYASAGGLFSNNATAGVSIINSMSLYLTGSNTKPLTISYGAGGWTYSIGSSIGTGYFTVSLVGDSIVIGSTYGTSTLSISPNGVVSGYVTASEYTEYYSTTSLRISANEDGDGLIIIRATTGTLSAQVASGLYLINILDGPINGAYGQNRANVRVNAHGVFYAGTPVAYPAAGTLKKVTRINEYHVMLGGETNIGWDKVGPAGAGLRTISMFYGGANYPSTVNYYDTVTGINQDGTSLFTENSVGSEGVQMAAGGYLHGDGYFFGGYGSTYGAANTYRLVNSSGGLVNSGTVGSTGWYSLAAADLEEKITFYGGTSSGGISTYSNTAFVIGTNLSSVDSSNAVGTARVALAGATLPNDVMFHGGGYTSYNVSALTTIINKNLTLALAEFAIGSGVSNPGGSNPGIAGMFYGGSTTYSGVTTTNNVSSINRDGTTSIANKSVGTARHRMGSATNYGSIRKIVVDNEDVWKALPETAIFFGGRNAASSAPTSAYVSYNVWTGTDTGTTSVSAAMARSWVAGAGVGTGVLFCDGTSSVSNIGYLTKMTEVVTNTIQHTVDQIVSRAAGASVLEKAFFYGGYRDGASSTSNLLFAYNDQMTQLTDNVAIGTARAFAAGVGIENLALFYAGAATGVTATNRLNIITNIYVQSGSELTVGPTRYSLAGAQASGIALYYGGSTSGSPSVTNQLTRLLKNGTLASSGTNVGTSRMEGAGATGGPLAVFFGGSNGGSTIYRYRDIFNANGTLRVPEGMVSFEMSRHGGGSY